MASSQGKVYKRPKMSHKGLRQATIRGKKLISMSAKTSKATKKAKK